MLSHAFSDVLAYVRSHVCTLLCVLSACVLACELLSPSLSCVPLICVLSYVCSHVPLNCVPSYVCFHVCCCASALIMCVCALIYAPSYVCFTCVLLCKCSHISCVVSSVCVCVCVPSYVCFTCVRATGIRMHAVVDETNGCQERSHAKLKGLSGLSSALSTSCCVRFHCSGPWPDSAFFVFSINCQVYVADASKDTAQSINAAWMANNRP